MRPKRTKEEMRSWFEDIRPDLLLDGLIEEEATFKDLWALFLKSKPSADPDDFEDFAVSYATGTNTDTEHKQAMDNIGAVRLATPKIHRELMALPHFLLVFWYGRRDRRTCQHGNCL